MQISGELPGERPISRNRTILAIVADPAAHSEGKLRPFVHSIPKAETHLHLEGDRPDEMLLAWSPDRFPTALIFYAAE